jgi:hypothetical protein
MGVRALTIYIYIYIPIPWEAELFATTWGEVLLLPDSHPPTI